MSIPYKKLKNLPESQNLQDSDITIIEDLDTTRKGTLRQLVQYLKWHNDINTYYAHQENIGAANGIAPPWTKTQNSPPAIFSSETKPELFLKVPPEKNWKTA